MLLSRSLLVKEIPQNMKLGSFFLRGPFCPQKCDYCAGAEIQFPPSVCPVLSYHANVFSGGCARAWSLCPFYRLEAKVWSCLANQVSGRITVRESHF